MEIFSGPYKEYQIFDTPGIYSVASFNDEERVALEYIIDSDIIVNVINANHLERDLFLTLQLIDMGKRLIIVLNMIDELEKNSIKIDIDRLGVILGVPIIPTIAISGKGFPELETAIKEATKGKEDKSIFKMIENAKLPDISRSEKILILEDDDHTKKKYNINTTFYRDEIYINRRKRVNEIIQKVIIDTIKKKNLGSLIGKISIHPVFGIPLAITILYLTYLFVGQFIAGTVVDFSKGYLGTKIYEYNIKKKVADISSTRIIVNRINGGQKEKWESAFPKGIRNEQDKYAKIIEMESKLNSEINFKYENKLLEILFGEFGIITMTISYIIFLLLPLVLGFYFMLSILEDSGYLSRLGSLLDRLLSYIGLNGRAIIPIILGFGCVSMATVTTRMLGSKRERTIAITILQLAIPCSAQLGVIATLLARNDIKITLIYIVVITSFLIILGTILSKFVPGETTPLLLDLPRMRLPRMRNVLRKTFYRSYGFMKEATPWFFFGALIISIMDVTGLLSKITYFIHPLVEHWLKLPQDAGVAFIMGLVRRDFGAAGLYDLTLTPYQTLVSLVVLTLFVPCITSLIIMFKEKGLKDGIIIWIGSLSLAFFIGGVVAQIVG